MTEDPGPLPDDLKDPEPTGSYPDDESSKTDENAGATAEGSSGSALPIVLSAGIAAAALAALVVFALLARRRKRARLAAAGLPMPPLGAPPPPPADTGPGGPWARPAAPPDDTRRP